MATSAQWLRTAEGYVRVPVLKVFYFIGKTEHTVNGMVRTVGHERKFVPGEHLLDPKKPEDKAFLEHPWVNDTYCDGYIESPDKTRARLEVEIANNATMRARHEQLQREAEIALERAKVQATSVGDAGEEMASALDTPLNQARVRRAKLPRNVEAEVEAALDTPLNKLAKG